MKRTQLKPRDKVSTVFDDTFKPLTTSTEGDSDQQTADIAGLTSMSPSSGNIKNKPTTPTVATESSAGGMQKRFPKEKTPETNPAEEEITTPVIKSETSPISLRMI